MVFEFKFPDVGEGITEGKLVKWLVKEGDKIKVDQAVAEVETDKAVVEIPSPVNGIVSKRLYKEQDTVFVGMPLMEIEKDEELKKGEETTNESNLNGEGDSGNKNADILALPAVRKYAEENNIDLSTIKGTGENGRILMGDLTKEYSTVQDTNEHTSINSVMDASLKSPKRILATPSTRQLARKLNLDIRKIKGTGNIGTITKEDVLNAYGAMVNNINGISSENKDVKNYSMPEKESTIVPMSLIRQTIAKKMSESKHNVAHVTIFEEADVTRLVDLRDKEKEVYANKGIKLTYLSFFTKAVVETLKRHPFANSILDESNNQIILKNNYNIGIAVDTEKGLLVPVVKSADKKSIVEIAKEISVLADKARNGKLSVEDMHDGTFTITSIGNLAGQGFTPIVNYPQAAILGIGRIKEKPIVKNKNIVIGKVVKFSLSFDHRIFDGAEASKFLQTLVNYIENMDDLFMEMI